MTTQELFVSPAVCVDKEAPKASGWSLEMAYGMTPLAATFPTGTPMAAPEPKEDEIPMDCQNISTPMQNNWKRYMAPYSPNKNPILGAPKKEPIIKANPPSEEYNPDDEKYYVPVSRELKFNSKYEEEVYIWANKGSLLGPLPSLLPLQFADLPPLSSAPFTRSPKNYHNSTPMAGL